MAFCTNCGVKLSEGVKFCKNCGKAVRRVEAPPAARIPAASAPLKRLPKRAALGAGIAAAVLIVITIAAIAKPFGRKNVKVFSIDLDGQVKVGTPIKFKGGSSLAEELQWLAVHTACIGIYNNAQAENYTLGDPHDYYKPEDIRQFLTERSGSQTKTDMFYGVCFNYAEAAYNDMIQYADYYQKLGVREWYIAATGNNPGEITLYDTAPQNQASLKMNGVYVKNQSRQQVRAHGNADRHAWLWVYADDGEVYWIDPTWTDNTGYPWWGVVRDGEELQLNPLESLCVAEVSSGGEVFAYLNKGKASMNRGDYGQAILDYGNALRIDPNNAEAYKGRGKAYGSQGAFDRALADLNQAVRFAPKDAKVYQVRAAAYAGLLDYERALADANQAIKLDPNDAYGYVARCMGYALRAIGWVSEMYTDFNDLTNNPLATLDFFYRNGNKISVSDADINRAKADLDTAVRLAGNIPQLQEAQSLLTLLALLP